MNVLDSSNIEMLTKNYILKIKKVFYTCTIIYFYFIVKRLHHHYTVLSFSPRWQNTRKYFSLPLHSAASPHSRAQV